MRMAAAAIVLLIGASAFDVAATEFVGSIVPGAVKSAFMGLFGGGLSAARASANRDIVGFERYVPSRVNQSIVAFCGSFYKLGHENLFSRSRMIVSDYTFDTSSTELGANLSLFLNRSLGQNIACLSGCTVREAYSAVHRLRSLLSGNGFRGDCVDSLVEVCERNCKYIVNGDHFSRHGYA
jgi:hypothetical protein